MAASRKAIVTGAASGIGRQTAISLAREGASVALLDVDEEGLRKVAAEIGSAACAMSVDVRSATQVGAAVEEAVTRLGGLDTLVVCAGVIHIKPLAEVSEADWDRTLDINLKGAFLCCQAAAPALTASGRGRIVTISSDAGRRGAPLLQAYTASKFGLVGLTGSLARELAPAVTVNCVCPAGVPNTAMGRQVLDWKVGHTGQAADAVLSSVAQDLPLGRHATEDDIADAVLFLVSESASFITGVTLDVDGGGNSGTLPGLQP